MKTASWWVGSRCAAEEHSVAMWHCGLTTSCAHRNWARVLGDGLALLCARCTAVKPIFSLLFWKVLEIVASLLYPLLSGAPGIPAGHSKCNFHVLSTEMLFLLEAKSCFPSTLPFVRRHRCLRQSISLKIYVKQGLVSEAGE